MVPPDRRGALLCVAAGCLALLAPPFARAQEAAAPGAPVAEAAPQERPDALDPSSPMAELPDLGVEWPDLGQAPEGEDSASAERAELAPESRYRYEIAGLDGVGSDLLRRRFEDLSVLEAHDDEVANAAQIDRRAREDSELLGTLMRAEGYYDARVLTSVEPQQGVAVVRLEVEPGPLYRLSAVTLPGLEGAGDDATALRSTFGIGENDPVNADAIAAGTQRLRVAIGESGFPFARIEEPVVTIDHATRLATLELPVAPGGERVFGRIVAESDRPFGARHMQEIARFSPGDPYDTASIDDLRRALIQTGLASSVRVTPVEGQAPGTVDVAVALEPAPPRTIAGELGYGTGEGIRAEVSWTHRNLFPPEGALTVRGVLGTEEQLANVVFRRNNFRGRDRVLTAQIVAAHLKREAYEADLASISASLERQTNIFFQKAWTWSFGAELTASDERDVIETTGAPRRRTYFVGAIPLTLNYDGSDDLLDPTRGFRLGGRLSPELSLADGTHGYARVQLDASAYYPVTPRVVVAGRVRLGSIAGASRDVVAPSRRFYAGGGASVRGYGYQQIGPRDPNGDPIGGRSLAEFSLEARVKAFGNFGIVPFIDGGNIYTSQLPKFDDFRFGAGVGVRYHTSFGPIRLDVGTPLNPQPGDPSVAVYVSLGQAF